MVALVGDRFADWRCSIRSAINRGAAIAAAFLFSHEIGPSRCRRRAAVGALVNVVHHRHRHWAPSDGRNQTVPPALNWRNAIFFHAAESRDRHFHKFPYHYVEAVESCCVTGVVGQFDPTTLSKLVSL